MEQHKASRGEVAVKMGSFALDSVGGEVEQSLDPSPGASEDDMIKIDINAPTTTAELLEREQLEAQKEQAKHLKIIADDSLVRRYRANTKKVAIPILDPTTYDLAGAAGPR